MASKTKHDKRHGAAGFTRLAFIPLMASAAARTIAMRDLMADFGVLVTYSESAAVLPYKPITSGNGRWDKDLNEMARQLNDSRTAWDGADTSGWSWDLTLKADYDPEPFQVPVEIDVIEKQMFFKTGGMLSLQTPTRQDGSALPADSQSSLCVLRWDLADGRFNEKLRTDDGTCSSALGAECITALTARVKNAFTANGTCSCTTAAEVPECANAGADAAPWTGGCHATPFSASTVAAWAGGRHSVFAYTTGGWYNARELTDYNNMGSVAWPVLAVLADGDDAPGNPAHSRAQLACVRATHAAEGWEVPSIAAKNTTEAGDWGEEAQSQDNAAGVSNAGTAGLVSLGFLLSVFLLV